MAPPIDWRLLTTMERWNIDYYLWWTTRHYWKIHMIEKILESWNIGECDSIYASDLRSKIKGQRSKINLAYRYPLAQSLMWRCPRCRPTHPPASSLRSSMIFCCWYIFNFEDHSINKFYCCRDTTVAEGDVLTLTAKVGGEPFPEIRWEKVCLYVSCSPPFG